MINKTKAVHVGDITYYFSTDLHRRKFLLNLQDNRQLISKKLSKRYHFKIENNLLADLYLYITVENRGFLIEDKRGGVCKCLDGVKLDGETLTISD